MFSAFSICLLHPPHRNLSGRQGSKTKCRSVYVAALLEPPTRHIWKRNLPSDPILRPNSFGVFTAGTVCVIISTKERRSSEYLISAPQKVLYSHHLPLYILYILKDPFHQRIIYRKRVLSDLVSDRNFPQAEVLIEESFVVNPSPSAICP